MNITKKQIENLWGDTGPYSQVHLIVETRIMDDKVSRTFLAVEIYMNPFSYKLIKKFRKKFNDDKTIQNIIDYSEYQGESYGYVSQIFHAQYLDGSVLAKAQEQSEHARDTVIKIHKFVMNYLKSQI